MLAVLHAFALIAVVMAVGIITGRCGVLGENARTVLNRTAFHIGVPALLLISLADAHPAQVFSRMLASSVNAGNLGIPLSAYVLGSTTEVASLILFQAVNAVPHGLHRHPDAARRRGARPPRRCGKSSSRPRSAGWAGSRSSPRLCIPGLRGSQLHHRSDSGSQWRTKYVVRIGFQAAKLNLELGFRTTDIRDGMA